MNKLGRKKVLFIFYFSLIFFGIIKNERIYLWEVLEICGILGIEGLGGFYATAQPTHHHTPPHYPPR